MKNKEIEKYKLELKNLSFEPAPDFKTIHCRSCSESLPAENLNINDKIAKCTHCNIVFSFDREITDLLEQGKGKKEVDRPVGIDIFSFQDDLDISVSQPMTALEIITLCFLPFITFVATAIYLSKGGSIVPMSISWMLSFLLGFNFFNRSKHKVHLSVGEKFLTVKWRPKKLVKDRQYLVSEIDQVYTAKDVHGKNAICIILNKADGQEHIQLLKGLDNMSKARYLEQEIEYHLGIIDREVPEESI